MERIFARSSACSSSIANIPFFILYLNEHLHTFIMILEYIVIINGVIVLTLWGEHPTLNPDFFGVQPCNGCNPPNIGARKKNGAEESENCLLTTIPLKMAEFSDLEKTSWYLLCLLQNEEKHFAVLLKQTLKLLSVPRFAHLERPLAKDLKYKMRKSGPKTLSLFFAFFVSSFFTVVILPCVLRSLITCHLLFCATLF